MSIWYRTERPTGGYDLISFTLDFPVLLALVLVTGIVMIKAGAYWLLLLVSAGVCLLIATLARYGYRRHHLKRNTE